MPVYYFINLLYLIINISLGENRRQVYESNEWSNNTKVTSILVGVAWVVYACTFIFLKSMTDIKLERIERREEIEEWGGAWDEFLAKDQILGEHTLIILN